MTIRNGRFRSGLHPEALRFSTSLPVDGRLVQEDIAGSIAHVRMLSKQKILTTRESARIVKGLRRIGTTLSGPAEDIHMAVEYRLTKAIGAAGGKLHTGRSRNDQIALDERLFLRTRILKLSELIRRLQATLVTKASQYQDVLMPGYTHLQHAQPVLLPHHLLAYVGMLDRDRERMADCLHRVARSPLGAGALAGSSFPLDRRHTARALGFGSIIENSIDAVSDRDVNIEFIAACAITQMHLSRLAEELVLWSSQEWRFVDLGDAFTTGSSIMPQKRNPDMAELVRGKTGRVYGDLVSLLTVMKGLPLAYNRDMQEDKAPMFDAADTTADCLRITALMMRSARFDRRFFARTVTDDYLMATELADYQVRKGVPFRKAHALCGRIVRDCIRSGKNMNDLTLTEYRRYSTVFANDLYPCLDVRKSLSRKRTAGSTSPREVVRQIIKWKRALSPQRR
jgi:argininosuccinate lyase